jgi:hypothetical protein
VQLREIAGHLFEPPFELFEPLVSRFTKIILHGRNLL